MYHPITWEFSADGNWYGKTIGILSHVEIKLQLVRPQEQLYRVEINLTAVPVFWVKELDHAKKQCEEKLNAYALDIIFY